MATTTDLPVGDERVHGSETQSSTLFRRITVCVDGSAMSDTLVHHAADAAKAFDAPLTILRVLEPDPNADTNPPDPLDWDVRQREARANLDQLIDYARRHGINAATELIQGRAAEQICLWTLQHDADLTVLASHGEHGRSVWTLSSTARKLVDGVPGSVFLVPADGEPVGDGLRVRRIMVPLDGSVRAESVLPIAARLATAHAAEVLVAHVTPGPELIRVGPLTGQDLELEAQVIARNERVARGYLDQIRARLSEGGVSARTVVMRTGDVRTRLTRLVKRENVDLVVVSAYGRRGPRDAPCGSVTAHLLTHMVTPVLVFRERPRRVMRRLLEAAKGDVSARPPAQAIA